jgi:hypothetical protein
MTTCRGPLVSFFKPLITPFSGSFEVPRETTPFKIPSGLPLEAILVTRKSGILILLPSQSGTKLQNEHSQEYQKKRPDTLLESF